MALRHACSTRTRHVEYDEGGWEREGQMGREAEGQRGREKEGNGGEGKGEKGWEGEGEGEGCT